MTTPRRIGALACVIGIAPAVAAGEPAPPPDAFAQVLKDAGLSGAALGFRRNGTWSRYPDAPYKLPFFDDLIADPTATYEFTRTLGNTVEDLLTPEALRAPPEKDKPGSLYLLGTFLATDRRIGGFRGFGHKLLDRKPPSKNALSDAIADLRKLGKGLPGPAVSAPGLERVPDALAQPLAPLVLDLVDARTWIDRGLRRVSPATRRAVHASLPTLIATTPDGERFFPEIEDAAAAVDEPSLWYGCLKALAAVQDARREIAAARPAGGWPSFQFSAATPWGPIQVFSGKRSPFPAAKDAALLVLALSRVEAFPADLGATTATQSMSIGLLMDGADAVGDAEKGAVARGVLGCGIVYSAGDANTIWQTRSWGLGAGMFGLGALVDEGGDDVYRMRNVGQGAGAFGAGLLLDAQGNDRYELLEGDGQGFGGPNGIGVLGDRSGNDHYFAEASPEKAGKDRADYHSQGKVVSSNAQGAGMGRRGDMTDGHAWAGGLGALIDVDGDDEYQAGNFSQGIGYWFGTGLLYDGGGNDTYRSVYFTQASGAHFAIGAIVDEGGNDVHVLGETAGAGLGFGWDVVNALLLDRAGNDRYEAKMISIGVAEVRSNGWFIDEAGDDVYLMGEGEKAFGDKDEDPRYVTPGRISPFPFHLPQLGLFLDLGGADRYLRQPKAGGDPIADKSAGDNRAWGGDGPRGAGGGANVGRGRDVARGRIGWLDAWPRRVPPATPMAR